MLDRLLSDGLTVELARVLRSHGVPTQFLVGHGRVLPSDMDGVIWLEKPVSFRALNGRRTLSAIIVRGFAIVT